MNDVVYSYHGFNNERIPGCCGMVFKYSNPNMIETLTYYDPDTGQYVTEDFTVVSGTTAHIHLNDNLSNSSRSCTISAYVYTDAVIEYKNQHYIFKGGVLCHSRVDTIWQTFMRTKYCPNSTDLNKRLNIEFFGHQRCGGGVSDWSEVSGGCGHCGNGGYVEAYANGNYDIELYFQDGAYEDLYYDAQSNLQNGYLWVDNNYWGDSDYGTCRYSIENTDNVSWISIGSLLGENYYECPSCAFGSGKYGLMGHVSISVDANTDENSRTGKIYLYYDRGNGTRCKVPITITQNAAGTDPSPDPIDCSKCEAVGYGGGGLYDAPAQTNVFLGSVYANSKNGVTCSPIGTWRLVWQYDDQPDWVTNVHIAEQDSTHIVWNCNLTNNDIVGHDSRSANFYIEYVSGGTITAGRDCYGVKYISQYGHYEPTCNCSWESIQEVYSINGAQSNVILGTYNVAEAGCSYTVTASTSMPQYVTINSYTNGQVKITTTNPSGNPGDYVYPVVSITLTKVDGKSCSNMTKDFYFYLYHV